MRTSSIPTEVLPDHSGMVVVPCFAHEHHASAITGLAVPTLRSMRVRGGGPPYYKVGRCVRYDVSELVQWMRERRAMNTAEAQQRALTTLKKSALPGQVLPAKPRRSRGRAMGGKRHQSRKL